MEENNYKSSDYSGLFNLLKLFLVSVVVAFSPAIFASILYVLDITGIKAMPDGAGALSFIVLFTMPAGVIIFVIGVILMGIRARNK